MFFVPPLQLLHDTKSIFCHEVQFFHFLSPEVSDIKTRRVAVGALMLLSPNFFMTQSQSSLNKFRSFIFLPLEVSV